MVWAGWSLRRKLIAACVLVELAVAALLTFGSIRLLQRTLEDQARSDVRQVSALLDQAIAAPLAQRDYATLQQTLDLVRSDSALVYLVLWDHRDKWVAASGWDAAKPLPPRDGQGIDLQRADTRLHLAVPVTMAGQLLGRLDVGMSTNGLRRARAEFLQSSLVIGAAALGLSVLVLGAISFAITRHLARLSEATQRVAAGDLDAHVPVTTKDEIGRLGVSFNAMAMALKQRVAALEESENQQRLHLKSAREEQSRLVALLGAMPGGILFVDAAGHVIYANAAFSRIWSVAEALAGRAVADILPAMVRQVDPNDVVHLDAMAHPQASAAVESLELTTLDGRILVQRMQAVAQAGQGSGWIWFHDDVTLERQIQLRAHQALHDPLTRLVNRRGLYETLQSAMSHAAARRTGLALLFVDLDDFKQANDLGGHRLGDEILVAVARALSSQMRRGETVARLGGDEFALLCPGLAAEEASAVATRLVQAVSGLRFSADGREVRVGCSIGIACYPNDARTDDDLVACADSAMYQAKQGGKNGWAAYRSDQLHAAGGSSRVNWGQRIQRALQDQRFVLHFQPVHRAVDLKVVHHEALLRMVDETDPGLLIAPGEFIAHAEQSGRIRQIDRWVFEACIARLAAADPNIRIAANMSARTLEDESFPGFLRAALQRRDVDPRRLHIELTETFAIADSMVAHQRIKALRGLGCSVHLDDFGSGFRSFAHLKLLDVDTIKIDGAFVRDLPSDDGNRLFVASMIEIAHQLGKSVVAEHVEDAATLDILRSLGVDLVQGFHLGRPTPGLVDSAPRGRLQVVSDSRRSQRGEGS